MCVVVLAVDSGVEPVAVAASPLPLDIGDVAAEERSEDKDTDGVGSWFSPTV